MAGSKTVQQKKGQRIPIVCTCVLALFCIAYPAIQYINSVYSWHIAQPEVYEGAIVLILAFGAAAGLCAVSGGEGFFGSIGIWLVYLSYNGVIIPFTTAAIYLGTMILTGKAVTGERCITIRETPKLFIAGMSLWGACAILLSLAGRGGFNELRILTVLLAAGAYTVSLLRERKRPERPRAEQGRDRGRAVKSKLYILIALFFLAYLAARTNTQQDYDSIWYGLRPEYVLVGEHSFYDYLGLRVFVHYYPKLMELFLLPVSNLGDYSFIICGNICFLGMAGIGIYLLIQEIDSDFDPDTAAWTSIFLISIPAAANIAGTAKADILGYCLIIYGFLFYIRYLRTRTRGCFAYATVSLAFATGTKLNNILWAGIAAGMIAAFTAVMIAKDRKSGRRADRKNRMRAADWIVLGCGALFIAGIHYRTYRLTGYWVYPVALSLQEQLLHCAPRHGALSGNGSMFQSDGSLTLDFGSSISRIWNSFFSPTKDGSLLKIGLAYITPCALASVCLPLIWRERGRREKRYDRTVLRFLVITSALFFAGSIYFILSISKPDGNYFALPLSIVYLTFFYLARNRLSREAEGSFRRLGRILLPIAFAACLWTDMFTSWSWSVGTKRFDQQILQDNRDTAAYNRRLAARNGYSRIYDSFAEGKNGLTIAVCDATKNEIIQHIGRIETVSDLHACYPSDMFSTAKDFTQAVQESMVTGFLIEKGASEPVVDQYLQELGYSGVIDDEKWIYYNIE